ncbi:MAG: response regulator, partial [Cyanobacteria bacterium Co-bin8]|nr:response regulator [Cyanobacteria bacterium Co-bin8]
QAMFVWWGEELINLYNDAYQAILGGKHPIALGQPAAEVWHEIWDQVGPRAELAMRQNEGTYDEALLLLMERNGYPEETYYTFSYSPVPNEQGDTGGIICANTDDTQRIIGERQLALLKELAASTADARTFDAACTLSAHCLASNPYDFPFAAIYLVDSQQQATLAGTCGLEPGHPVAPQSVSLSDESWPFATVLETHKPSLISDLSKRFTDLPTGAWDRPPQQAVVVPIAPTGQAGKAGILVAGLNPFRLFDDNYQRFLNLVSAQITASIANAQAYEEERQRAEALAELDQAKTIFFSNVSHEFRTPLTLMLGPLEDALASLEQDAETGEPGNTRNQAADSDAGSAPLSASPRLPGSASPSLSAPALRQQLQLAHRNSLRLLKLVNTLLDFSRIEAGRIQATYEATDLANFTTDLASVFRSAIEQAGLQLEVDCSPFPEPVYVDREMWEKIVLNLLSNAFKFTLTGKIQVSLHCVGDAGSQTNAGSQIDAGTGGRGDAGNLGDAGAASPDLSPSPRLPLSASSPPSPPCVVLEVRDTGIGIPAEEIPHLFERFHRVKGAQGRSFEGSGIGLSLIQELIKLHAGSLQVESVLGQGSTFTVSVPIGTAHLPQERVSQVRSQTVIGSGAIPYVEEALRWLPESVPDPLEKQTLDLLSTSVSPLPPAVSRLPTAHILLADDNADMRDYVGRLLSQQYEVAAVADGKAALATIEQQRPDLVLLDVMMPGLDGFEVLRQLRSNPNTCDIPIILLSARAGEESRMEGLEAGADDYLVKPFSARELLARVEASLKLAQLRREATQREQVLRLAAETAQQSVESVLSSINDGFFILDRNWCFTYCNSRNAEIIGLSQEQVLGQDVWELFPDVVGTEVYRQFQQTMTTQTAVQFEYFYPTWERWFEYRVYPSPEMLTVFVADVTERKRAETALQAAEERLRVALQNAPIAVFNQDQDLCYTWIYNPSFGYQAEEVLGKQDADLVSAEQAAELTQIKRQVLRTGVGTRANVQLTQNGQDSFFDLTVEPLWGADDTVVGVTGAAIDISELKQTEIALRESEAFNRQVLDSSYDCIKVLNLEGQLLYINPGGQALLQITDIRPFLNRSWFDLWQGVDHQAALVAIDAARAGGVGTFQGYRPTEAGEPRWWDNKVSAIHGATGQVEQLLCISRDITERRRAELEREQLLARERHYANQLQGLTTAALAINSALSVEDVLQIITDQAAAIVGSHQSVASMTIDQNWAQAITAIHLSDKYAQWRDYEEQSDGSGIYACVCHLNRPMRMTQDELEAHPRWRGFGKEAQNHPPMRGWLAAPLVARDGQNMGLIQLSDKYEGEFTAADEAILVQLAQMASVAVENARLYEAEQQARSAAEAAREEAQAANRVKDEFLAVLSHELRSPLNPILGWSKLLQSNRLNPTQTVHAISVIERNARLQSELIEDLLDVSRILQGKLRLTISPVNLSSAIGAAIETVRLAAEAKGIEVRRQEAGDSSSLGLHALRPLSAPITVAGDATRLQQVFWNLLSNAVKFTPAGGRVEVRLEAVDHHAQVTVSDTGEGISPAVLPRIFDYFRQADSTTTRKFGGLGLGLAIVRHLVELHGGTIWAESPGEGQGATFTLRLPLFRGGSAEAGEACDRISSTSPTAPLAGKQILVVDDEIDSREFVVFLLEQAGAEVRSAANAGEALAALRKTPPDVLISDIGMPDLDGYMLIRQVRALQPEQGGQTPAVALTAYAGEFDQQQAIRAGFQLHVSKPVEPDALVKAICSLIEGGDTGRRDGGA